MAKIICGDSMRRMKNAEEGNRIIMVIRHGFGCVIKEDKGTWRHGDMATRRIKKDGR